MIYSRESRRPATEADTLPGATLSDQTTRDEFLASRTRFAMLTTLRADGSPITLPVWFEWDGEHLSMFCAVNSLKLTRLARDSRITVLIANDVDEPEYWVAFDGTAHIHDDGGFELAERLAAKYWDLDDPERAEALDRWRSFRDVGFRRIVLAPTRIREYQAD
jgi:PPOX class probable F420-dependent enzyme